MTLSPATLTVAFFVSASTTRLWPGPLPSPPIVLVTATCAGRSRSPGLVVGEVVGPDALAVPVRLLVGEPAHLGAERSGPRPSGRRVDQVTSLIRR